MDKSEASIPQRAPLAGASVEGEGRASSTKRRLSRWHAAGAHLLISAGIAGAVLVFMLAFWYPQPLFQAAGGADLALILIGVDVVIGPLLTLAVFKAGKRGLKFDLTCIALLQIAALVYGSHIIYLARPAFIVFVKDQFQVVSAVELEPERLAEARYPQFRSPAWTGPVLVAGDWPAEQADRQRLLDAALAGEDLQHFPRYYAPYAEGTSEILAKAWPMSRVRASEPETARIVDAWLARSRVKDEEVLYLPLRARHAWVAVLIDRKTAQPVKMLIVEKF
jgi:hypothetical protein